MFNSQTLLEAALTYSVAKGYAMSIAIVDDGGYLLAFNRMNGAAKGTVDVAIKKAKASALFSLPSGLFGDLLKQAELQGMEQTNGGLCLFPGGVPVLDGEQIIGAIGVSGGSAEQDLEVAEYALEQFKRA